MKNPFSRKPKPPSAGRTATAASANVSGGTQIQTPLIYAQSGHSGSAGSYGMYGISPTFAGFGGPDYTAKGQNQTDMVAAFCAGIKHALDKLCPAADPAEREKLLLEAVAFRLAPTNSAMTGRWALLIDNNGAVRLTELAAEEVPTLHDNGTWIRDPNQDDKRPFVVYRPAPIFNPQQQWGTTTFYNPLETAQNPYPNQWVTVTTSWTSLADSLGLSKLLP